MSATLGLGWQNIKDWVLNIYIVQETNWMLSQGYLLWSLLSHFITEEDSIGSSPVFSSSYPCWCPPLYLFCFSLLGNNRVMKWNWHSFFNKILGYSPTSVMLLLLQIQSQVNRIDHKAEMKKTKKNNEKSRCKSVGSLRYLLSCGFLKLAPANQPGECSK